MRLISNALIAALLSVGCAALAADDSPNPDVDSIFADLTKAGSPGCALGIYRDGKIIYAKGYGLANIDESVPITPQTVFDVGSVSKQFTAASILLLERQGKLRLNDDVHKYVPELPDYSAQGGQKITILQLLNHTSGVRDYPTLFLLAGINPDNVTTDDDALGTIVRQKGLTFPPGTDRQYSNSGYFLLSVIVKRVSGKTLKDFVAENIFRPLGMMHTQLRNDHTELITHRALAYDPTAEGVYKLSGRMRKRRETEWYRRQLRICKSGTRISIPGRWAGQALRRRWKSPAG
jgi:CubicO group peptidase (beta-lactamase class C family)